MIFFDYLVYGMHTVYIYGHCPCKEQLFPSILLLVGNLGFFLLLDTKPILCIFFLDADRDYLTVLSEAQEMLRREHSIARMTIQIEPYDEYIMNSCENCRRPDN